MASYQSASLPQTVTVKDTGTSAVTFQRNIGGINPSEFAKKSDGCAFNVLNAGQSCQLTVSFAPKAFPFGARTATLTFVDDAATTGQTVKLSGTSTFDPPIRQNYVNSNLPCSSVTNTKVQSISRGPGTNTNMWLTEVGQSRIGTIPVAGGSVSNLFVGTGSKPYGLTVAPSDTGSVFFTR